MATDAYSFLSMTVLVAALVSGLTFAVLKLLTAARSDRRVWSEAGHETAFMADALERAMETLRSEERAVKARAEASERLSSGIINSLTSGLLVVDEAGIVRILNPAGAEMLGLGPGVGQGYRELLTGSPALANAIAECLKWGKPIVRRAVPINGSSSSHLGLTASPLRAEEGPKGAICLFTDLTEVMELEEQLRLQDSLARLGELTAGIAHEFRNGLATIHGYARLIDLETLPTDVRKYVNGLRDETGALTEVVTKFLEFARPARLVRSNLDLASLVARVAAEVNEASGIAGVVVRVSGEYPDIEGDEVLLKQALSNLCRKALEACDGKGVSPEITISGTHDTRHGLVHLAVADNGPGISPAAMPKLFQPFFTTKPKGTGLGLALVQKIIVLHQGRVVASNRLEGGARFDVVLPASVTG